MKLLTFKLRILCWYFSAHIDVQNIKSVFDSAIKVVLQPPKQKKSKKKAQRSCSILWMTQEKIMQLASVFSLTVLLPFEDLGFNVQTGCRSKSRKHEVLGLPSLLCWDNLLESFWFLDMVWLIYLDYINYFKPLFTTVVNCESSPRASLASIIHILLGYICLEDRSCLCLNSMCKFKLVGWSQYFVSLTLFLYLTVNMVSVFPSIKNYFLALVADEL